MGLQKFYANPRNTLTYRNGAVGYRPGGSMDCLGPYAKIVNCPIEGTFLRRTCYATAYPDTHFSVPAACKVDGCVIRGFFTIHGDGNVVFVAMDKHREHLAKYYEAFKASEIVRDGL